jgi:hypothetical protein
MENIYNPAIHHRRSIRLSGHNYRGNGLYFVTICAHQEFRKLAKGNPFLEKRTTCVSREEKQGARCVSPVLEIIEQEWLRCGKVRDDVFPAEFVVMPDHFHGLIRIVEGRSNLGNVIGAFKAAVSKRVRSNKTDLEQIRIWQRNYYEVIVRNEEMEKNIANYIRMNPWRCIMEFSLKQEEGTRCVSREEKKRARCISPVQQLRGMGNPALWNEKKIGVLCSRNAPKPEKIPNADVYFGGFHSPMEKKILQKLLELKKPIIYCPAWGLGGNLSKAVLEAL